jgi:RimJ/RimL family protein N-acetyltransferase
MGDTKCRKKRRTQTGFFLGRSTSGLRKAAGLKNSINSMTADIQLRDVQESDLPIFFEQQQDPLANQMAAFPARNRDTFMAHWVKIMQDETIFLKTILFEGQVAGNLVSFVLSGEREVGYWLGREFWGKGIATRALSHFLQQIDERPLYAHVAKHNIASQRVLEKCGFTLQEKEKNFAVFQGEPVEGLVLKLSH